MSFFGFYDCECLFGIVFNDCIYQFCFGGGEEVFEQMLMFDGVFNYKVFGVILFGFDFLLCIDFYCLIFIIECNFNFQDWLLCCVCGVVWFVLGIMFEVVWECIEWVGCELVVEFFLLNEGVLFIVVLFD